MWSRPKCSSYDELDILIEKVTNKADKEFDNLVNSLNINKEKNKEWAASYYSLVKSTAKLSKSIKRLKVWKWILLIPLIFPFFLMNNAQKKKQPLLEQQTKELKEAQDNLHKQLAEFRNKLSFDLAYNKIISEAWPDVRLDLFMNKQTPNWELDYSQYMPKDSCATSLVSGTMFDHPFVMMNRKDQTWHPHVYTGSLPVTYTVTVDGKTETRTEIVVATVTLPEPSWDYFPYFLYKTSKPENLTFCNDANFKELKKSAKKGTMQSMDNPEFDKVFPAHRNNEIEYRVVFTPAAQEGFVNLFKNIQYKIEKVNEVTSIVTACPLIDNDFSDDVNYDLGEWKRKYCDWVGRLTKHLATFSLPIANMPVYYQMSYKPHSKGTVSRLQVQNNTDWLCNEFGINNSFETDVIYQCKGYKTLSIDKTQIICSQMSCNYFHPHHRVQMVPTPSRRGVVMVPVHVIDYLPRSKELFVYQTTNSKNVNLEITGNDWAIHSGQFLTWSWHPITDVQLKKLIQQIEK